MARDDRMYFYDGLADRFDSVMNMYDTTRRVEVVFDELLGDVDLAGARLLDGGSGTGWFSRRAAQRGARVTSLDVGLNLLRQVAAKCRTTRVAGDLCHLGIADAAFDVVASSDVIEHTPDPRAAVREMCRVLRPGGTLVVTVPNRLWKFSLAIANALRIRPYQGLENWVSWRELRAWVEAEGLEVEVYRGVHLFPFVFSPTHRLLRFCDRFGTTLGPLMVNLAIRARKPAPAPPEGGGEGP